METHLKIKMCMPISCWGRFVLSGVFLLHSNKMKPNVSLERKAKGFSG